MGKMIKKNEIATLTNKMIAVADVFARAKKQMTVYEYKTFVLALTEIKRNADKDSCVVMLNKKELAKICGVQSGTDHLSGDLAEKIKHLPQNSFITVSNADLGVCDSGNVVSRLTITKNQVRVKFEEEYLFLFTRLQSGEYITMWADDLLGIENSPNGSRAMNMYEDLRLHSDTRQLCERVYTVSALRQLWNIPSDGPGSYVRANGIFDRTAFEKKVLELVLGELAKCKMLKIAIQSNKKLYEKVKKDGHVVGYKINWTIADLSKTTEIVPKS